MNNNKIVELFGRPVSNKLLPWDEIIKYQICPFDNKKCYKTRKSDPDISIGTCSVMYGKPLEPVIICPKRLLDSKRIFIDCLHLLTKHQPGNDYHLLREFSLPSGNIDFVLVSVKGNKVVDFVGIELQTLDTTGTIWPERQKLFNELGIDVEVPPKKNYGMNWKMTAKTILTQMNHKAETFEAVNRHLVLVIQDPLLKYMKKEFNLSHFTMPADLTDTVHFHSYGLEPPEGPEIQSLKLSNRLSTSAYGISKSLGRGSETSMGEEALLSMLSNKISSNTYFNPLS